VNVLSVSKPRSEHTGSTTTGGEDGALDLLELKREVDLPPVVRLVNDVLIQAIDERASDIHIEPYENRVLVRNRIDGILYDTMRVPAQFQLPVVSRLCRRAKRGGRTDGDGKRGDGSAYSIHDCRT
jgi:type II secretory ATPase GspE/PulE/Tfp pilus assembly ATPase PilB-like protein